jgi:tetratricopeptide (TPR) repeat protein
VDLLEPPEQLLFAQLGVFAGGFTLDAAEEVFGEAPGGTVDAVEVLLENSLLRRTASDDAGPRFAMLSTIRDYALGRLKQSGEDDRVRLQHAEHFAAQVERAEPEILGGDSPGWAAGLGADYDNIRAALQWSLESGRNLLALRLAAPLARFWRDQGYLREGARWLEDTLAREANQPVDLRAKALRGLTALLEQLGDLDAARVHGEAALALCREEGDHEGIAETLLILGLAAFDSGDHDGGVRLLEDAASDYREAGNERGVAYATGNLGYYTFVAGDAVAATECLEQALGVLRHRGDARGQAWLLENLALVALTQGRLGDAAELLSESLALCRRWQMQDEVAANGLVDAATIATRRGDFHAAARLIGAGDAWRETAGLDRYPPLYETARQDAAEEARKALGEARLAVAFADGRALRLLDALDEAMRVLEAAK